MRKLPTPETDAARLNHSLDVVDAEFARRLERERDEAREALQRLADCDWVITLPDRMDAVRKIALEALLGPNYEITK